MAKESAATKTKAKKTTKKKSPAKKTTKRKAKSAPNKTLLIVESPSKAKTINKYLGSNYIVEASVGHIKDLVKFNLGVDVENDFQPKYVTIRGKADIIKKLKQLAGESKNVLIATDPDREGEAIAWHIAEEVRKKNEDVKRALFNEITKNGVKNAIKTPLEINENLFMSQQARRVLDRLIGYKVSPLLSKAMILKTSESLSAGRVQSVALKLICERERRIIDFDPIEYWTIQADFENDEKARLNARLVAFDGKNIKNPEGAGSSKDEKKDKKIKDKLAKQHFIRDEKTVKELEKRILKEDFAINSIQKKQITRRPQSPFTTSLLQQESSRRLGFSNKKTMMIAQKLYEGVAIGKGGVAGLITYMRTDSTRVSPDAQAAARDYIDSNFGKDFLPEKPPHYASKSGNVQDAHEAVRPTSMELPPKEAAKYLTRDEVRLYELIFNRFIASQMSPAKIDQTTVEIGGGDFVFRASGSVIAFKGFLAIYGDFDAAKSKNGSNLLPENIKEKDELDISNLKDAQSFTKAPPRYNEASLVKELDELGIGRPSTYAQIISTILDRKYAELVSKSFAPTQLGLDVNEVLGKHFPSLFNVDFTAKMEEDLDAIGDKKKTYLDVMKEFYGPFSETLKNAEENGDFPKIVCEECGGEMVIKVSRRGRFLGCSNYPDCTNTKPLPKGEMDKPEQKEPIIAEGVKCKECGGQMLIREGKYGKFFGCENYPKCTYIQPITTEVKCPKCKEGDLIERFSKKTRKRFFGCSNYPKCDYLTNYEPIDKRCGQCGHYYLEARYRKVDEGFVKYLKCPECKTDFEIASEEEK